jgi:hypothetical protein
MTISAASKNAIATVLVPILLWMTIDCANAGPQLKDAVSNAASGIEGQVSIHPMRPHATIGRKNIAPFQATVEVLNQLGQSVATFQSDADGHFRIALPPGRYTVRPIASASYPRASQQEVVVESNKYTDMRIVYDSGIR